MIRGLLSLYRPRYPQVLVYMLQNTEYHAWPYIKWFWRTQDFSTVEHRRKLVRTKAARLLLLALTIGILTQILLGLGLIFMWAQYGWTGCWGFGLALIVSYPVLWAHLVVVPLLLGRIFIVMPRDYLRIRQSERIFREHPGEKIAIVGSYGKTSMKELLLAVLSEGKNVRATPANKNVAASHAAFARSLKGDEDILLIEYGEGKPGDIVRFARTTHPTRAVVTGVAAAHLDHYKSTADAGKDIFSIARFISDEYHVYANGESEAAKPFVTPDFSTYDRQGALGWKVGSIEVGLDGLEFTFSKDSEHLKLKSGLLGRHNVGPLSLVAGLAMEFGIPNEKVAVTIAQTAPFEHRMQPYQLHGAWVIDDTYNGNIEGIKAGTELLKELPAKRKLYATPGLVDQGAETKSVHETMGRYIAASGADLVILMQNSVTDYIMKGLEAAGFKGELRVESDPLDFYTNLGAFLAAGDLILLQNDWPDNYA